jgi:ABC-type nickel/cobalt efflux system permease component RcnA
MNTDFNVWHYLVNVAPVVLVMGIGIWQLWARNTTLTDKMHERDLANLKTLEQMLVALRHLDQQGQTHFHELRQHITDRIKDLRKEA